MRIFVASLVFGLLTPAWSSARCSDNDDLVTLLQTRSYLQPGAQRTPLQRLNTHAGQVHAEKVHAGISAVWQPQQVQNKLDIPSDSLRPCHKGVPRFELNLDLPPSKRWKHIASYWGQHSIAMLKVLKPRILDKLGEDFDAWVKVVDSGFDEEANDEIRGIVEAVNHPSVTSEWVKIVNFLYELESPVACSGVLWSTRNGTVIHGRNMDYVLHFQITDKDTGMQKMLNWPDVTFEVMFKREGKPLFIATQWPLGIGVATAMRFNGWSFEQQTRTAKNDVKLNLAAALQGGKAFSLLARRVMESTPDFSTAVDKLFSAKLIAPQYFIMSGKNPHEGAVLTVDRLGKHEADSPPIVRLNSSVHPSVHAWHLVQTNDDLLGAPLDRRRPEAEYVLNKWMSQDDISSSHMATFMSRPPVYIPGWTVYTTVMVPATGTYLTILPDELPHEPIINASMLDERRPEATGPDGTKVGR
jgi:hypothetical protein